MRSGEVIADRFEVSALAGEGGMGSVYRAIDRHTGHSVALKLLRQPRAHLERFLREANVLLDLEHPGIVAYVAHGTTHDGEPYLAMEWLEGDSLGFKLAQTGLTIEQSIEVVRRVAEALAVAHARGIVHRDLKPENLLLVDGRTDCVKVLDFGVAFVSRDSERMTRAGIPVGTLGYMAPEQARAERDIDARADVFALGCVLFECLTGRPAFYAEHALTVLAKIVLEEPPRARELRADVPPELDQLIARMLAKERERRPANGSEVAAALAALGELRGPASARTSLLPTSLMSPALGESERQVMSAVVAGGPRESSDQTLDPAEIERVAAGLRAVAEAHGARIEALAGGALVLVLAGRGSPTDRAARAARSALELARLLPGSAVALTTGWGTVTGRLPMGEVIDRAVGLVEQAAAAAGRPRIDDVTEGLLPARFQIAADGQGRVLVAERRALAPARVLLGKPAPCVGRERELIGLRATLDHCLDEGVSRVVLLSGVPGVGKSRIRHELLSSLEDEGIGVDVWIGQADPMRAGTPFGLLADAIRRGIGLADPDPNVRRAELELRVSRHVAEAERRRVSEFLGELLGLPFSARESPKLFAARQDPILLRDQVQRAFIDLLSAETAHRPLLLVLEDLHWGDLPSIELVDAALRSLPETAWMVLAVARPEVHDVFPALWTERDVQEIRVRELTRRASEQLIREILGPIEPDDVARIAERAAGNAFFLEELMRAEAAGRRDAPGTVLAMVQTRLESMEPEARRVLRAASIFGQVFWRGGVAALLGDTRAAPLDDWLERLGEREVIVRRSASKLAAEPEFGFRHALVRDAAYAMLTESDRALGHRLAGDWLERIGETEALVVLEHFDKGGAHDRAVPWWVRAAESALDASDFAAALALARRGMAHATDDETRGTLSLIEAEALRWRGELDESERRAKDAMQLLSPGSPRWGQAAAERALIHQRLGRAVELAELARELLERSSSVASESLTYAMVRTAIGLRLTGEHELSDRLLGAIDREGTSPRCLAYLHLCRALDALHTGDMATYLDAEQTTRRWFEEAGDTRRALNESGSIGYALMELGAFDGAERTLALAHQTAQALGLDHVVAASLHNLGLVYAQLGRFEEAIAAESRALETFRLQNDRRLEGAALTYLARIHQLAGNVAAAAAAATLAVEIVREVARPILPLALATLAAVRRNQRRYPEALEVAREAIDALEASGAVESGESLVRLEYVRALAGCGRSEEARAALHRARERLESRAARIADPELRQSFLERVPENAETLAEPI